MNKIMDGENEGKSNFKNKVIEYLKKTVQRWKTESNIGFILYNTAKENGGAYEYYDIR